MSKKSALEREVDALKGELDRLRASHRDQLDAKNREIERLKGQRPAELTTLMSQYRHLRDLLALLQRVAWLADPVTSIPYDTQKVTTSDDTGFPIEGQGTRRDRERQQTVGRWLGEWAEKIRRELQPRGEQPPEGQSGGPRCWRRECEGRARRQSWDNTVCQWCGEPFSAGQYAAAREA